MSFLKFLVDQYKNKNINIDLKFNGIVYDTDFDYAKDTIVAKSSQNPSSEFASLEQVLIEYIANKKIDINITIKSK